MRNLIVMPPDLSEQWNGKEEMKSQRYSTTPSPYCVDAESKMSRGSPVTRKESHWRVNPRLNKYR